MKKLMILSAAALVTGALALSACDSCPPQDSSSSDSSTNTSQTSMTCGQGTVKRGNQCVANDTSGTSTRSSRTLSTRGNN